MGSSEMTMKLNFGNVLQVAGVLHASLVKHGVLDAEGNAVAVEPHVFAQVGQDVEDALKAAGVVVPPKVEVLISLLPGILSAFGA